MNTITKEWLKEKEACHDGYKWFVSQDETHTAKVMLKLVEEGRGGDALWVLEQIMDETQSVKLAVFSAKLCIKNFEKDFPNDDRPRKAIEAAENYLNNPCEKTAWSAESAAWSAESAAESAAWSAAWSAESAAWSAAESAARSAAWSAESAAWSAESAAWSAESAAWSAESAARSAAKKDIQTKIIKYAIDMIGLEIN